jgi:hypothetical protein
MQVVCGRKGTRHRPEQATTARSSEWCGFGGGAPSSTSKGPSHRSSFGYGSPPLLPKKKSYYTIVSSAKDDVSKDSCKTPHPFDEEEEPVCYDLVGKATKIKEISKRLAANQRWSKEVALLHRLDYATKEKTLVQDGNLSTNELIAKDEVNSQAEKSTVDTLWSLLAKKNDCIRDRDARLAELEKRLHQFGSYLAMIVGADVLSGAQSPYRQFLEQQQRHQLEEKVDGSFPDEEKVVDSAGMERLHFALDRIERFLENQSSTKGFDANDDESERDIKLRHQQLELDKKEAALGQLSEALEKVVSESRARVSQLEQDNRDLAQENDALYAKLEELLKQHAQFESCKQGQDLELLQHMEELAAKEEQIHELEVSASTLLATIEQLRQENAKLQAFLQEQLNSFEMILQTKDLELLQSKEELDHLDNMIRDLAQLKGSTPKDELCLFSEKESEKKEGQGAQFADELYRLKTENEGLRSLSSTYAKRIAELEQAMEEQEDQFEKILHTQGIELLNKTEEIGQLEEGIILRTPSSKVGFRASWKHRIFKNNCRKKTKDEDTEVEV